MIGCYNGCYGNDDELGKNWNWKKKMKIVLKEIVVVEVHFLFLCI